MSRLYQARIAIDYWIDFTSAYLFMFTGGLFLFVASMLLIYYSEDVGLIVFSIFCLGVGVGTLWYGIRLVKNIPALKQKYIDRKSMISRIDKD